MKADFRLYFLMSFVSTLTIGIGRGTGILDFSPGELHALAIQHGIVGYVISVLVHPHNREILSHWLSKQTQARHLINELVTPSLVSCDILQTILSKLMLFEDKKSHFDACYHDFRTRLSVARQANLITTYRSLRVNTIYYWLSANLFGMAEMSTRWLKAIICFYPTGR